MGCDEKCTWRFWRFWTWEKSTWGAKERFILIYILDTNIISYIIKNRDFLLIDKFEEMSKEHIIAVSSITVAELFYGVMKKNSKKLEIAVNEFLLPLQRLYFDEQASYQYALIRTNLEHILEEQLSLI
mgnify:CR=1 FL=1